MTQAGMSPVIAVLSSGRVSAQLLGVLIERIAYKPLRNASSSLAVLITAIGVSYLLQNMWRFLCSARMRRRSRQ